MCSLLFQCLSFCLFACTSVRKFNFETVDIYIVQCSYLLSILEHAFLLTSKPTDLWPYLTVWPLMTGHNSRTLTDSRHWLNRTGRWFRHLYISVTNTHHFAPTPALIKTSRRLLWSGLRKRWLGSHTNNDILVPYPWIYPKCPANPPNQPSTHCNPCLSCLSHLGTGQKWHFDIVKGDWKRTVHIYTSYGC